MVVGWSCVGKIVQERVREYRREWVGASLGGRGSRITFASIPTASRDLRVEGVVTMINFIGAHHVEICGTRVIAGGTGIVRS